MLHEITIITLHGLIGVAISLGILGTTYCDLGELSKAEELLQKSVDINRKVNGPRHIGTGIAQPSLAEWRDWLESCSQQERHWRVHWKLRKLCMDQIILVSSHYYHNHSIAGNFRG